MSLYKKVADRFAEHWDGGYFASESAKKIEEAFKALLESGFDRMIFLLGEPGSGKSYMLKKAHREAKERGIVSFLFETPDWQEATFLHRLGEAVSKGVDEDMAQARAQLAEIYRQTPHMILLDEAQLITRERLEFVRMLHDTGAFRFVLAMHRQEGEAILAMPHFRSRAPKVIEAGQLTFAEVQTYIQRELEPFELHLPRRVTKALYRYSAGNFRIVKRLLRSLFLMMEEAMVRNLPAYQHPTPHLLCMAAIEAGVERD